MKMNKNLIFNFFIKDISQLNKNAELGIEIFLIFDILLGIGSTLEVYFINTYMLQHTSVFQEPVDPGNKCTLH